MTRTTHDREADKMYFFLFKSNLNHQWYFNIRAANHERIAASEGYLNKQDAIGAINLIRRGAANALIFDDSVKSWAA